MIRNIVLFISTFFVCAVWANTEGQAVHVNDVYPPLAFFAAIVVAVLGWLLKTLITRDRAQIDEKIDLSVRELRNQMDGIGLKLEHLADVVDAKVSEAVEELRRHDMELFKKWDLLNREMGQLKGEHDTLKPQHHRAWRPDHGGKEE